MKLLRLLAAIALLLAAATCQAGLRWYDTYAEAQKLAAEYDRPMVIVFITDEKQIRSIKRMFEKPQLKRVLGKFIYTYEIAHVKDNTITCALFRKYSPKGMQIRMPMVLIFFAGPDEKVLYKLNGAPDHRSVTCSMAARNVRWSRKRFR